MNILLWVLQIALALLCISGGAFQIAKYEDLKKQAAAIRELPKGLWAFFGACNVLGGLGLFVPAVTPFAAAFVAVVSIVISALYIKYGDKSPLAFSAAMALMAALIAYGRFS